MRRSMIGGLGLALILSLAAPVLADDKDGKSDSGWSWWPTWLGGKKKTAKKPARPVVEKPVGPSQGDLTASLLDKEMNAFLRRQRVADRLAAMALEAGDDVQLRRINQLQDRIFAVYQQRTAHLSSSQAGTDPAEDGPEQKRGTTLRRSALPGGVAGSGEGDQAKLGGTK